MGNECCQGAVLVPATTVKGDQLRGACTDVIDLVTNIHELVDEAEGLIEAFDDGDEEPSERSFADACNSLTIGVGELVRSVIEFTEPDAGMEPL